MLSTLYDDLVRLKAEAKVHGLSAEHPALDSSCNHRWQCFAVIGLGFGDLQSLGCKGN